MQGLNEREQKLIEYIKILINVMSMYGIFNDQLIKLFNWRAGTVESMGFGLEFQDEMLKTLGSEFGVKYKKLDPITHQEIEEDGDQS